MVLEPILTAHVINPVYHSVCVIAATNTQAKIVDLLKLVSCSPLSILVVVVVVAVVVVVVT
jgi:hypothetical protein